MRRIKIAFLIVSVALISYIFYFFLFTTLRAEEGSQSLQQLTKPYDLVIKHALILDGTGEKERFRGDIAIREGLIVEVGSVTKPGFSTFDAGGLTVMPIPVRPKENTGFLEHLFRTSFPRYPAHYLYFQDGPYQGFNLAQISRQREETPQNTFNYLQKQLPAMTKVYLVSFPIDTGGDYYKETSSLQEIVAYLTGYQAKACGQNDCGVIKPGYKADFYFFVTRDYDEESLKQLFLKGQTPEPVLYCQRGKLLDKCVP